VEREGAANVQCEGRINAIGVSVADRAWDLALDPLSGKDCRKPPSGFAIPGERRVPSSGRYRCDKSPLFTEVRSSNRQPHSGGEDCRMCGSSPTGLRSSSPSLMGALKAHTLFIVMDS
jgi:hypothetical protein